MDTVKADRQLNIGYGFGAATVTFGLTLLAGKALKGNALYYWKYGVPVGVVGGVASAVVFGKGSSKEETEERQVNLIVDAIRQGKGELALTIECDREELEGWRDENGDTVRHLAARHCSQLLFVPEDLPEGPLAFFIDVSWRDLELTNKAGERICDLLDPKSDEYYCYAPPSLVRSWVDAENFDAVRTWVHAPQMLGVAERACDLFYYVCVKKVVKLIPEMVEEFDWLELTRCHDNEVDTQWKYSSVAHALVAEGDFETLAVVNHHTGVYMTAEAFSVLWDRLREVDVKTDPLPKAAEFLGTFGPNIFKARAFSADHPWAEMFARAKFDYALAKEEFEEFTKDVCTILERAKEPLLRAMAAGETVISKVLERDMTDAQLVECLKKSAEFDIRPTIDELHIVASRGWGLLAAAIEALATEDRSVGEVATELLADPRENRDNIWQAVAVVCIFRNEPFPEALGDVAHMTIKNAGAPESMREIGFSLAQIAAARSATNLVERLITDATVNSSPEGYAGCTVFYMALEGLALNPEKAEAWQTANWIRENRKIDTTRCFNPFTMVEAYEAEPRVRDWLQTHFGEAEWLAEENPHLAELAASYKQQKDQ